MEIIVLGANDVQVSNKELEVAAHKLGFTITGTMPTAAETARPNVSAIIAAMLGPAEITLTKQSPYATDTLHQSLLVKHLAEMSTSNEGFIYMERNFDAAVAANNTVRMEFTIELADLALDLSDKEKLMVSIKGKPAGTIWTIEAIEHPANGQVYIAYDNKFVNANVQKEFETKQHSALSFPINNLVNLELQYVTGKVVRYTKSEVMKNLRDSQDVVATINNQVIFGFLELATIRLADEHGRNLVSRIKITLDQSTNFYLQKFARA